MIRKERKAYRKYPVRLETLRLTMSDKKDNKYINKGIFFTIRKIEA